MLSIMFYVVSVITACCEERKAGPIAPAPSSAVTTNSSSSFRSTIEIRQKLILGMTTNEVIRHLGMPLAVEDLGNTRVLWRFQIIEFPADDEMRGAFVSGISTGFTNGRLAHVGFLYAAHPSERKVDVGKATAHSDVGAGKVHRLKLFTVSTNSIPGGRFVDSRRFPQLGYISLIPDLEISQLKSATAIERSVAGLGGQSNTVWVVKVFLSDEDSKRLESLTRNHASETILMVVDNEPVFAPRILGPIATGSFELICKERSLFEFVKPRLTGLVPASPAGNSNPPNLER